MSTEPFPHQARGSATILVYIPRDPSAKSIERLGQNDSQFVFPELHGKVRGNFACGQRRKLARQPNQTGHFAAESNSKHAISRPDKLGRFRIGGTIALSNRVRGVFVRCLRAGQADQFFAGPGRSVHVFAEHAEHHAEPIPYTTGSAVGEHRPGESRTGGPERGAGWIGRGS